MQEIVIAAPPELITRIEELARRDERTRPAQIRYLLRLAVSLAERRQPPEREEASDAVSL